MNIDDYKCNIWQLKKIGCNDRCNGCNEEVYTCDVCNKYLRRDCFVACIPDGRHLCEECFEEWIKRQYGELNAKQQLKQEEI